MRHWLAILLVAGCNDPRLLASGTSPDAGAAGDAGSPDAPAGGDPAAARLIAPSSTSTVTQQMPTLRWVNGSAAGSPVVDLCADRACAQPLAIAAPVLADGASARPSAPLPPGWVYWRVRTTDGSATKVSATWQLWVGKASASSAVDTSGGTVLDINGDGFADLLVGAGDGDTAYVYLGNPDGSNFERIDLISPDGPPVQYMNCSAGGVCFGGTVASIGDVNGDGYSDFVVGKWLGPGALHVYLGGPAPRQADWNGAAAPRRIDLPASFSMHGTVAAAGDVNGDGYADFLASTGALYLGSAVPSAAQWTGTAPPLRVALLGPTTDAVFGIPAGVGDVNGDGYDDFVFGAYSPESDFQIGYAHVYFGGATIDPASWNGATAAARIDVVSPDDSSIFGGSFGGVVAAAGDVNGDGYADFLVGAQEAGVTATGLVDTPAGIAHLFYGGPNRTSADWNGVAPPQRVDIPAPSTENFFAWSAAAAGDVDGDGYADFVVGSGNDSTDQVLGAAHVYLGGPARTLADWSGTSAPARLDIATPDGVYGYFSNSVAGLGDVNGDGLTDILIGAHGAASGGGAAHVVYGVASPSAASWNGASAPARIDLASPSASAGFGGSVD